MTRDIPSESTLETFIENRTRLSERLSMTIRASMKLTVLVKWLRVHEETSKKAIIRGLGLGKNFLRVVEVVIEDTSTLNVKISGRSNGVEENMRAGVSLVALAALREKLGLNDLIRKARNATNWSEIA
jgi:hypothetical protein